MAPTSSPSPSTPAPAPSSPAPKKKGRIRRAAGFGWRNKFFLTTVGAVAGYFLEYMPVIEELGSVSASNEALEEEVANLQQELAGQQNTNRDQLTAFTQATEAAAAEHATVVETMRKEQAQMMQDLLLRPCDEEEIALRKQALRFLESNSTTTQAIAKMHCGSSTECKAGANTLSMGTLISRADEARYTCQNPETVQRLTGESVFFQHEGGARVLVMGRSTTRCDVVADLLRLSANGETGPWVDAALKANQDLCVDTAE